VTEMGSKKKLQPTRWEKRKVDEKRITPRKKKAIAEEYERELAKGSKSRDSVIKELASRYNRDPRTIEGYIAQARKVPTDELADLVKRWRMELKGGGILPPREMLRKLADVFLEPKVEGVVYSPETIERIEKQKSEGKIEVICQVEQEVLFQRLVPYLPRRLLIDYGRRKRKAFEYICACQDTFYEMIDRTPIEMGHYFSKERKLTKLWNEVEELRISISGRLETISKLFERLGD